jgi:phosphatidate cytidylyltransferase
VDERPRSELKLRVGSALVLAPVAAAAIYFGTPYFEILLTLGAVAMAWEWDRICGQRKFAASGWVMAACLLAAGVSAGLAAYDVASAIVAVGALGVYGAALICRRGEPLWTATGTLAVGIPCIAAVWLRNLPHHGLETFVWLVGAIWMTDLAAYVTGRLIGGARLAPRISPGKTWAGLIGAMAAAAVWGVACAAWVGAEALWAFAVLGAIAAVLAQTGDLAVSLVKRRFGVKDASNLIPGHGGVLDRFDGLMIATPALALLVWSLEGGIFAW